MPWWSSPPLVLGVADLALACGLGERLLMGVSVTRYAVEARRHDLIASWDTGWGDVAHTVAQLPDDPADRLLALPLAGTLSRLSTALWRRYTRPMDPTVLALNGDLTTGPQILAGISHPNLPTERGVKVEFEPIAESAHDVGRVLHELGRGDLTAAVLAEVEAEIRAIDQAERGDLTGRAAQAATLSRADASPAQVAAAEDMLAADPLGGLALLTGFDPTAAAVAASRWLHAAATAAAKQSGVAVTDVPTVAQHMDAPSPLPDEQVPTLVLELLEAGRTPSDAVTFLVRQALAVADGYVPDLDLDELSDYLHGTTYDPDEDAEPHGPIPDVVPARLTLLNPHRPARRLLDCLINGIDQCWMVYRGDPRPVLSAQFGGTPHDELIIEDFRRAVRAAVDAKR